MNVTIDKVIKKASVYYRNNKLYEINNGFVKLTGYTYNDIIGQSLNELYKKLRISKVNCSKNSKILYQGYIFTNNNEPKYVEIICKVLDKENEEISFTQKGSNEFLKGLLSTCLDINKDKTESVAIYSYPDLIHLKTNKNYTYTWKRFNPEILDLTGMPYIPINHSFLTDLKKKGCFYKEEKEFTDNRGNTTYWTIKSNLIYEDGEARYLKNTFIEETSKVLIRKTFEKQKTDMEIILDNIPGLIIKLNNQGEYTYTSKINSDKLAPYREYNRPLNTKEVFEFFKYNDIHGKELSFEEFPDYRVLKGEILNDFIIIGTSPFAITYHQCNGTPIYDSEGNIEGAILLYKDIEDSIKNEEYNTLTSSMKNLEVDYVTMSYKDFNIKYINDNAFESIKKICPHVNSVVEVIGGNFFDFYTNDVKEKKEIISKIKLCIKEKSSRYIHKQKLIEEGKINYIKTIFQPIFDKNNQVEKITSIGMYITDEELANQQMSKALRIQDEIFVNTSHELKTPINLIFSASQLLNVYLKNESVDYRRDKIEYSNKIIMQNCYRTIKLINNILDVSKMEQGFYDLSLENKNIVSVVDNIVMSVSDYIKDKKLSIIFDPKVEEKFIALDLYKFERIMLNLISNAIKFSKNNGVIFLDLIDKEDFIEVSIKDQGIGIDEQNLKSIFKKFNQENKSFNRKAEGTGIGLSLVQSMVELHGGTIDVESTVGVGSKFTIHLPTKTVNSPINLQDEYSFEDKVEMIRFELSDIYS